MDKRIAALDIILDEIFPKGKWIIEYRYQIPVSITVSKDIWETFKDKGVFL